MTREIFQAACIAFINIPYRWGGDDPIHGFDCSGLAQELMDMLGLDPIGDQTAQGLYEHFKAKSSGKAKTTGTLCFYGKNDKSITHVGVMLDSTTMIEAGGGGSTTTTHDAAAIQNAYIRLRPFNKRRDLIAVITPDGLPW
jgi:cell wall-associated NlpC family hydrolase